MATKISFYRGDTPLISVPITVGGGLPPGVAANYSAFFTLTTDPDPTSDVDAAIEKTSTPTVVGNTWVASFQLTNTDTQNLDPNQLYYWDFQLVDTSTTLTDGKHPVITTSSGVALILTDFTRRIA